MVETTKADALVKSVESLVAEKEAVATKEKELVAALNAVLNKVGYEVVPVGGRVRGVRGGRGAGAGDGGVAAGPDGRPRQGRAGEGGRQSRGAEGGAGHVSKRSPLEGTQRRVLVFRRAWRS